MDDKSFQAKYLPMARLLWQASEGCPERIPSGYAEHLQHCYADGTVSLAPAIVAFDNVDALEDWQFDEAVELLSRVNPEHWPDLGDIDRVDVEVFLDECGDKEPEFVEDNLGTSHAAESILQQVIEDIFGDKITDIRSAKGHYPSPDNNFLQLEDGTFAGVFTHGDYKFDFEIAPTEAGWICTYRLNAKSLDKVPRSKAKEGSEGSKKEFQNRKVRFRGW